MTSGVGLLGAAVLGIGALTACTSGSGSAGGNAGGGGAAPADAAASGVVTAGGGTAAGSVNGARSTVTTSAVLDSGLRIRTAVIRVGVRGARNVAAQADAADAIAIRAGGEVDTDDRTSGRQAAATLQVRVPPQQLQPVLNALAKLGHEQDRQVSSTDVTQRVADVASRAASAGAAIARLRRLYRSAQKVSDVIEIENELSSRESDLESLQAQQRALGRETAMAAVTLDLSTLPVHQRHVAPVKHHSRGGFVGGLSSGWHGFTTAASGVATAVGAALPFALLLLLLALAARLLWPRIARLRRGATDPAPNDGVS